MTAKDPSAKSVIPSPPARYNRLPLELADFEGVGVYYAATQMEAKACMGGPVLIVGGGNSAGQAALYLALHRRSVDPAKSSRHSMYSIMIDQIEAPHPLIQVLADRSHWSCRRRTAN